MSAPPSPTEAAADGTPALPNSISDRLPSRNGYAGVSRSAVRWLEIMGGILTVIGISVFGVIVVGILDPSIADGDDPSDAAQLGIQAFLEMGFITAAIGASMLANKHGLVDGLRRLGLRWPGSRIFSTILIAVVAYAVIAITVTAILEPQQDDIAESLGADENSALMVTILAGILIVPAAAIAEELFFRGLVFGGMRQTLPLWPAALASGVVFGSLHLTAGDVGVALQLSLFGAILAWTYERSGTLWTPIVLHGVNNAIAFTILINT
jgi:membrane protease YdiL (CAAX protease family)